jgi:hypothetical protein
VYTQGIYKNLFSTLATLEAKAPRSGFILQEGKIKNKKWKIINLEFNLRIWVISLEIMVKDLLTQIIIWENIDKNILILQLSRAVIMIL